MRKKQMETFRAIILFLTFSLLSSCGIFPESSFNLSDTSRIPTWFELPEGVNRTNVSVKMDYYITPLGRSATFTFMTKDGETLGKAEGAQKGLHPNKLKNPPEGFPPWYPSYEVITVNGITEVIEHRKMEPTFYITDNPQVLEELGVTRDQ